MKTNSASWSRGRRIAVIAAGLVLLLIGVGAYGLIAGPRQPTDPAPAPAPAYIPANVVLMRPGLERC